MLLTPEMSASGYGGYPEVLATAEVAGHGPIYTALAEMARREELVILAGFVELDGEHRYLAHYAVWPDGHLLRATQAPGDTAGGPARAQRRTVLRRHRGDWSRA